MSSASSRGGESAWHKIDRYSDVLQRSLERESSKDKPLINSNVLEFFEETAGFKPTAYQERLLLDQSQFIAARWARQSGKSLCIAVICLYVALSGPNRRIIILGPSFRQSRRMVRKIASFLSRLPGQVLDGRPLRTKLSFVNGSSIESFPNSPETIRGETSHLVLWDEGGYIQDSEELYDATVYSIATTNGRFIATSTPGSRNSLFFEFCMNNERFGDFSRHHVSYREALEPKGPLKQATLERLERQRGDDPWRWRREMEAEFSEDEEAWLKYGLITECVEPDLEYFTDEEIEALPDIVRQDRR